MRTKLWAGMAGAALTVSVGLGVAQLAHAETPSPSPTQGTSSATPQGDIPARGNVGHHEHGQGRTMSNLSELARTLGVPEQDLSEALSAAREQLRSDHSGTHHPREVHRAALAKTLAAELGIEEADVSRAFADMHPDGHANRAGMGRTTLESAVADGILTQNEADGVQKALDAGIVTKRGAGHGHR